jgi:hypothetical protein
MRVTFRKQNSLKKDYNKKRGKERKEEAGFPPSRE